jgi:hypothetical protein
MSSNLLDLHEKRSAGAGGRAPRVGGFPPQRRPFALIATAIAALSACQPPPPDDAEESDSNITANANYRIAIVGSGKCLDVVQAGTTDGAKIQQWPCDQSRTNQAWTMVPSGSGVYELVSVDSGKVMDVNGGLTTSGAAVTLWTDHHADNQRWKLVSKGSGQYQLQSVKSGKCLDVTGASTADGALLEQWTCHAGGNQLFTFAAVSATGGGSPPPDNGAGSPGGGSGSNDGCTLRWSPSASRDGKSAFEGLEMPDSNGVHPGAVHFSTVADHDAFRVDQHVDPPGAIDYDHKVMDRVRCETKGMHTGSTNLSLLQGETWKLSWSLFIPGSLKGSTHFNHIWQMKHVDTSGGSSASPIVTLDLINSGGSEKIRVDVNGQVTTAATPLVHDRWLDNEITIKIAAGGGGSVHWILRDAGKVLIDDTKSGVTTWPADAARLRPKWGIYRSLADTSGNIKTTYILLSNMKAYTCSK